MIFFRKRYEKSYKWLYDWQSRRTAAGLADKPVPMYKQAVEFLTVVVEDLDEFPEDRMRCVPTVGNEDRCLWVVRRQFKNGFGVFVEFNYNPDPGSQCFCNRKKSE